MTGDWGLELGAGSVSPKVGETGERDWLVNWLETGDWNGTGSWEGFAQKEQRRVREREV
jgi:hypothetical protein